MAGASTDRMELLAGLGPPADADGGSLRRELATERVDYTGRVAHVGFGYDGGIAGGVHDCELFGAPQGPFKVRAVGAAGGFLCRLGSCVSRECLVGGAKF